MHVMQAHPVQVRGVIGHWRCQRVGGPPMTNMALVFLRWVGRALAAVQLVVVSPLGC